MGAPDSTDPGLEKFVQAPIREGRRVRMVDPRRIVLTVAMVGALLWLCVPTFDELRYHLSNHPLVDLGDVTGRPASELPLGAYVKANLVIGNRAAEVGRLREGSLRWGPIEVRNVLGAPLFVEFRRADRPGFGSFVRADVVGRIVPFNADSELSDVRAYLADRGLEIPPDARLLIVGEVPGGQPIYVVVWSAAFILGLWSVVTLLQGFKPRVVTSSVGGDDAGAPGTA